MARTIKKDSVEQKAYHRNTTALMTEDRVALVIGNAAYQHTRQLRNPPNDAQLMGDTLSKIGFRLIGNKPLINADRPSMIKAIRAFGQALTGGTVGLFYYSDVIAINSDMIRRMRVLVPPNFT